MKVLFWKMKDCRYNFALSKSNKTNIPMKKILSIILLMMTTFIPLLAQESNGNSSSTNIGLEFHNLTDGSCQVQHRAPIRIIDIEAFYINENNSIDICYTGEATGEVFLYLNNNIIEYNSEINTSFQISTPGLYKIEIIGETWIATGYIQL